MLYSNAYWKSVARKALQGHWLTAMLIALVVNLPSLLVQGIAAVTGNDLGTRLAEILYSAVSSDGTISEGRLTEGLAALQQSGGIWAVQGLNIAAWLLTPCLTLGMVAWLMGRIRNEEDPGPTAVFSRMNLFFKGIGLRLYVAWRIFLMMLPGVALCILAMLPLWLSDLSSRISVLSAANTVMGLESLASIAMVVLGVMAALRYALGDMVLAEHPDMGPIQAAKQSKAATKGRRGELFFLYTSFLLWYLLEMFAANLCLNLFGSIPALMVEMLVSLAITVYLTASLCAFYRGGPVSEPQENEIGTVTDGMIEIGEDEETDGDQES